MTLASSLANLASRAERLSSETLGSFHDSIVRVCVCASLIEARPLCASRSAVRAGPATVCVLDVRVKGYEHIRQGLPDRCFNKLPGRSLPSGGARTQTVLCLAARLSCWSDPTSGWIACQPSLSARVWREGLAGGVPASFPS